MKRILRIALSQVNFTVGDLENNLEKIFDYVSRAKNLGADIVTFPELTICGYPPEDLLLKRHFIDDNIKILNRLVRKINNIIAIVGFVDRDNNGRIYNAAAIIQNKKIKDIYHKISLPNYGVFDEKRYFHPGESIPVYQLNGIFFGVNICEDIWGEHSVAKHQADEGAEFIINISASPYHIGKASTRKNILKERAKKTKASICYNNLVGGQDELVFDGSSLILNSNGKELAVGREFEEDLIIADLAIKTKSQLRHKHKKLIKLDNFKKNKKPDLAEDKRPHAKLNKTDEVYKALVLGLRDYLNKNNFKKAIIGLSGGIDSSLIAVIACDAIGSDNVIGVSMPSQYSSKETKSDARSLAKNLAIKFIELPIDKIFKVYLEELKKYFVQTLPDVTEENLQARIRGNILMAFSNKFDWLVLSTGNKSETSCGYCTLYGDMVGGFAVLKDVPKTLVYKLARRRNKKQHIIPESVLKRAPSAELRENQKDEDTLPPYSLLDRILKVYIEKDKSLGEIINEGFEPKIVKEVIQMVDRNEYKRRQSPPGIKITPKAFGKDRRFPITNGYRELSGKD